MKTPAGIVIHLDDNGATGSPSYALALDGVDEVAVTMRFALGL